MNYRIRVKKLGGHWYPDIEHENPTDLILDEKIEKVLNVFDEDNEGELVVYLWETHTFVDNATIIFNDDDILRFLTTDDEFNMRFLVHDIEFVISASLFSLIEFDLNPNFHKCFYKIEVHNRAI